MKARVNVKREFCHLAPVDNPTLLTGVVVLPDNSSLPLSFLQLAVLPDVFLVTVPALALGQYELRVLYDGTTVWSDHLDVGSDRFTDFPLGEEVRLRLPAGIPTPSATVTARLVSPLGVVVGVVAASFSAQTYAFEFAHTFALTDAGDWGVVWLWQQAGDTAPIPHAVTDMVLCRPVGQELIRFVAAAWEGNGGTAHSSTTIVVSHADSLAQAAQGVTNQAGGLQLALYPGVYRATLYRADVVFSVNNFTFTVMEGDTGKGTVHLISEKLAITATPPAAIAPMCRLYADVFRMDGSPLFNAAVQVSLQHGPQSFSGTGVFDTCMTRRTDSNGHVEFDLVQGIRVEVLVAPLSLRRIITVPSGSDAASPVNLLTLLSQADDLFDIIVPNIPAAAKRSM